MEKKKTNLLIVDAKCFFFNQFSLFIHKQEMCEKKIMQNVI